MCPPVDTEGVWCAEGVSAAPCPGADQICVRFCLDSSVRTVLLGQFCLDSSD